MDLEYYSPCALGLELVLSEELRALGAESIDVVPGGVSFQGDLELGYRCCLWLRSAIRVQQVLCRFDASSRETFVRHAMDFDWQGVLHVDQTFQIDGKVRDSRITHSKFAALVLKDAIVDSFRERVGRRPNVDRHGADVPLRLLIREDEAVVSRDLAGMSLHKRGYRPLQVKAPLNESIAAGLLQLTGWDRESPLLDPMCGSGTFVIEAAMLAANRAPGLLRRFAHERWIDADVDLWNRLRSKAESQIRKQLPFELLGSDRHAGAIEIAKRSARAAGVADLVRFEHRAVSALRPRQAPSLVVCNPPYGERIGHAGDLESSWRSLGSFLHDHAAGADAWILSGDKTLTKSLGLRARRRIPVHNAKIECRWLGYPIGAEELHFTPLDQPGVETNPSEESDDEAKLPAAELESWEPEEANSEAADSEAANPEYAGSATPSHASQSPSPWIDAALPMLPAGSRVLDLAAGRGRHTRLLLSAEHSVVAVDKDIAQLGDLLQELELEVIEADLEAEGPWPLGDRRFDAIVVTNFLWRPLFPMLHAALEPGGMLLYETFMQGQQEFGKPTRPEHLLESNELLRICLDDYAVLAFEQGVVEEPSPKYVQRIIARKERE